MLFDTLCGTMTMSDFLVAFVPSVRPIGFDGQPGPFAAGNDQALSVSVCKASTHASGSSTAPDRRRPCPSGRYRVAFPIFRQGRRLKRVISQLNSPAYAFPAANDTSPRASRRDAHDCQATVFGDNFRVGLFHPLLRTLSSDDS